MSYYINKIIGFRMIIPRHLLAASLGSLLVGALLTAPLALHAQQQGEETGQDEPPVTAVPPPVPPGSQQPAPPPTVRRSEEHTSELQSQSNLVCRLLLEKKTRN